MKLGSISPGVKGRGGKLILTPTRAEVKDKWGYICTISYAFTLRKGQLHVFIFIWEDGYVQKTPVDCLTQCFSTAGPRPGTGPWHQLYRPARDSPGIDN